jgi:cobaltochelatase CobN
MHLLAAQPGGFSDEDGIIDLQQTPGEIVILSSQDTSLGLLADAVDQLTHDYGEVRLGNLVNLTKPAAYDLYEHKVLQHCKLIIVSLLGGISYWHYGVEQLIALAHKKNIKLVVVPGDDTPDNELLQSSNCTPQQHYAIWRYLREGGKQNTLNLFRYIRVELLSRTPKPQSSKIDTAKIDPPRALPLTMIYSPGEKILSLENWQQNKNSRLPVALLLFYRSHVQSGNTQAFDQLLKLMESKFNVLAVSTLSLKNPDCLSAINHLIDESECHVIINTTSFSQHVDGNASLSSIPGIPERLFNRNIPVIQAILAANSEQDWSQSDQGLRSRDIAMNIALPEFDGRIISRAVSFKEMHRRSQSAQIDVIRYRLHIERAQWAVQLAYHWAILGMHENSEKRIALILANYPTRDGRIGNGVGLDTPASAINILTAMEKEGFPVRDIPENGDRLIEALQRGVTNNLDTLAYKGANQSIDAKQYQSWFETIPAQNQNAILERWGPVDQDPGFRSGHIMISGIRLGETFVGIQPARGFNIDVVANYHDPDLVPPHGYLAFYFWIRHIYNAHAISHIGKHGNLEWLPGKSVALSKQCWPDVVLGPMPHLYPFIVNDPGEGAQAKRRAQAVILDHLMPPMARAETYGALLDIENLVDEYYQALGLDSRREALLRQKILDSLEDTHLLKEINLTTTDSSCCPDDEILNQLDTYLCDLKEAQIRHGLHRFGQLPDANKLAETLVALTRLPRGESENDAGTLHCLSDDLELKNGATDFDPLRINAARIWEGDKPKILANISQDPWRTEADTRERLELLAEQCMNNMLSGTPQPLSLVKTSQLMEYINSVVLKAVLKSGSDEIANFIGALNGKFVPPGPSGAPTRGRLDVLPTGRNFYSLDSRSIPTQSAWDLGQRSAQQLLTRHLQEHGEYPEHLGVSVWGTSTMRTGGDDIAQALALMGVKPIWSEGSNRVMDIEVIPGFQLGRPRVDVTLRISGFFRDAFPNVARLFDTAVQTLAQYQEPGDTNTIRRHALEEQKNLESGGMGQLEAEIQSRLRVFGSKPGSYGAGLQGLIDEGVWKDGSDLAQAYVNWGGYSYTRENFGKADFHQFESRLEKIQVVIQNQDNREHDLLDSDDYYQFQGGMANAIEVINGAQPVIYHGDHSNPAIPKIRTLKEELNRVIRARVINPKWIRAMQQHGYKGAFEMAASVDYIFSYDATTSLIDDYQYEAVTDALVLDPENRKFMEKSNPNAFKEMSERLLEAQQRGLWKNPGDYQAKLTDTILEIDNSLETVSD